MKTRRVAMGTAICLVVGLLVGLSFSQQNGQDRQGRQGGPGGGQGGFGGGPRDPAQMQQMMSDRMKQTLGATDEEWKVLGPKVMKVFELSRQTSGMGRGMMFGGRGGQRPDGTPRPDRGTQADTGRELSPMEKASESLQQVIENQSSTPQQIKEKLTALREAREKAREELAKAQQDLKKVLSLKQEAQLVLNGTIN